MSTEISIPECVTEKTGEGGLRYIELRFNGAESHVYLCGAHVLHYQPAGQAPVLWHSEKSAFEVGLPIRGGIPICWPWFGPNPSDSTLPMHGMARLAEWEAVASSVTDDATTVTLRYPDPTAFQASLELTLVLSDALTVSLKTTNLGNDPMMLNESLHTYFAVSDIREVSIDGLDGGEYIDALTADKLVSTQEGSIAFAGETNRIYTNSNAECSIVDEKKSRRIVVGKEGSLSTVVWNPWDERAAAMPDFGDEEYLEMVCVEAANCGANAQTIPAGESHVMSTKISVIAL